MKNNGVMNKRIKKKFLLNGIGARIRRAEEKWDFQKADWLWKRYLRIKLWGL